MRNGILPGLLLMALLAWSCTGMKNMSSTLSKSETPTATETRHNNYLYPPRVDTAGTSTTVRTREITKPDGEYRKDYAKLIGAPDKSGVVRAESGEQTSVLARQYEDMDKLADVVLYEIDVSERRYSKLLADFKIANAQEREKISGELDRLRANQITLYKSYVSIYKQGKADWPRVKAEVDATLLRLRGITDK